MRIGLAGVGRIGAFHAETLTGLDFVDELVVDRPLPRGRASGGRPARASGSPTRPRRCSRPVSTASSSPPPPQATPPLLRLGIEAGVPTFCEKPVALDPRRDPRTSRSWSRRLRRARARRVPAPLRPRLPAGAPGGGDGELGFVHTVRASTHDQAPPHAAYIPTSGGLFRDCSIHDFDIIRFVTGREVVSVFAIGRQQGRRRSSPRPATSTPPPRCSPSTTAPLSRVTATRYNGGGHDVRMEVFGSERHHRGRATTTPSPSPRPRTGVDLTRGPRHWSFMERFLPAYRAELTAFADVAPGRRPSPVHRRSTRCRRSASRRRASCRATRAASSDLDEIASSMSDATADDCATTSSPSAGPGSTSTRSTTASAWRTCGPSRSSSAAARPTWPWRPRATAGPLGPRHPHRARPVRRATSSWQLRAARRRRRVRRRRSTGRRRR